MDLQTGVNLKPDRLTALAGHRCEKKDGILVVQADKRTGPELAARILYDISGRETVLFLSGGKTPSPLYTQLACEQRLNAGAAAMVDERYGPSRHENSNELMIARTGLLDYFKKKEIPFYPVLGVQKDIESTARYYDSTVGCLLSRFSKSVAVLGIGEDGHIAGIAPSRPDFKNPLFSEERRQLLVSYFKDPVNPAAQEGTLRTRTFGERITMTIKGLSRIDLLLVLTFGEKKQSALSSLFREGPVEEVPSRFLKHKDIASRTILITDRNLV